MPHAFPGIGDNHTVATARWPLSFSTYTMNSEQEKLIHGGRKHKRLWLPAVAGTLP